MNAWPLLLLLGCMGAGALSRARGWVSAASARWLMAWVLRVALPAVVLRVFHRLELRTEWIPLAASQWLLVLVALALGWAAFRGGLLERRAAGAWALMAGTSNTAFMGLPMARALGGQEAMDVAVVVDQLGSFTALSMLVVPAATLWGGSAVSTRAVVVRVATFPPMVALVAGLLTRGWSAVDTAEPLLDALGWTMSPAALFALGHQLQWTGMRARVASVMGALGFKLVGAPALVLGALHLAGVSGLPLRVAVLQAAMAPMATAAVVATEHGLEGGWAALCVGLGVPLSLLTAPLWWWLLE